MNIEHLDMFICYFNLQLFWQIISLAMALYGFISWFKKERAERGKKENDNE